MFRQLLGTMTIVVYSIQVLIACAVRMKTYSADVQNEY